MNKKRMDICCITPRQKLIIAKGLCDYQYIMENWQVNDKDFQEVYYEFYLKARWPVLSNATNKKVYFNKLQSVSLEEGFISILDSLYNEMENHSYEFSLTTKLLHTRDTSMPIYDSKVRDYLSKGEKVNLWWMIPNYVSHAPRGTSEYEKIKHDWEELCKWYISFMDTERCKTWIAWFDDNFPAYVKISNVKKIDFIIFATN
ncbi:MAG: hypothetical protein IK152_07240 [Lachnospiraceae bacterium]|nr:hypothetical protein [Lachnospiraceae bacterium]